MTGPLTIRREGAVARVVLDRPEVSNALDDRLILAGIEAFTSLSADPEVRVIVLEGAGKHFCAGADLNWMKRSAACTPEENRAEALRLGELFERIHSCVKPVVARVQGAAVGGGSGLVAASDIAVAATTASFRFSEVRLGIIPAVISPYVVRRIGPGSTQALFLTGQGIDGIEAHRLKFVDQAVPADELDLAVDRVVDSLLAGGPEAQAQVKELIRMVSGRPPAEVLPETARVIGDIRRSPEAQEGMAAFLEKRPAAWVPPARPK